MFSLSLLNLNHRPFIPSHSHKGFQLCLLLRGRIEIWRAVGSAVHRSSFVAGDIWAVSAGELHLRYARPNSRLIGAATVSAALSALLSLEAAHACNIYDLTTTQETCDYTLEDLERDKQSGLRLKSAMSILDAYMEDLAC